MAKERDLELSGPPASGALHREWKEKKGKLHATVDQKYDMLVLRDKIIRLLSKPALSASDDNEGAVLGTCSEICPEKERYGRIKQDRVSIYEQDKHMVKDFSRQAADQEMPLPSELRTAKALRTTMNYLLREIIGMMLSRQYALLILFHVNDLVEEDRGGGPCFVVAPLYYPTERTVWDIIRAFFLVRVRKGIVTT